MSSPPISSPLLAPGLDREPMVEATSRLSTEEHLRHPSCAGFRMVRTRGGRLLGPRCVFSSPRAVHEQASRHYRGDSGSLRPRARQIDGGCLGIEFIRTLEGAVLLQVAGAAGAGGNPTVRVCLLGRSSGSLGEGSLSSSELDLGGSEDESG